MAPWFNSYGWNQPKGAWVVEFSAALLVADADDNTLYPKFEDSEDYLEFEV